MSPTKCMRFPWERGRNSKFLKFFDWQKSVHSSEPVLTGYVEQAPLFPCSLPFPEAFKVSGEAIAGEARRLHWAKAYLNFWVAWSNYIVLGCPDCRGKTREPRGGFVKSAEVHTLCMSLLGEVVEFIDVGFCTESVSFDGSRSVVDEALTSLQKMDACSGAGEESGRLARKLNVAIPVVSERVAIPAKAGSVDPLAWLPPERRSVVEDLGQLCLAEPLGGGPARPCHQVSEKEEKKLIQRLLAAQMITLVSEDELERTADGRLLVGGFFCVRKNNVEDRLIFDRRPANAMMQRLDWAHLPAGACLAKLLLEPDEFLRGSGDDLRTYYFSLALPQNAYKFNAVGRRVDPKLVASLGKDPSVPHRAAMRVLGMGDSNACDIAQAVHEYVLEQHGLLSPQSKMVYGRHLPDGPTLEGAYLDDLLVIGRVKAGRDVEVDGSFEPPEPRPSDPDMRQVRAAELAYEHAGLERALHKSFRAELNFKAWGAEIDGVKGTAGVPIAVRRQVWHLFSRVVVMGKGTKNLLQRLLGYAAFCFQFRRECFSLQHHVYKYLDSLTDDKVYRFPGFVLDELRGMMLHLPFCCWNMRRSFAEEIIATDATPSSGGATKACLPKALAQKLWKHTEVRGEAVRLDRDASEFDWVMGREPREPSRFASQVGESLQWRIASSYHFRHTAHINLQEARAVKREVVRLASAPLSRDRVHFFLNDSRVVVGAFTKGRSSSFRLNGLLRSTLPYLILSRMVLGFLWVETDSNPADHPSRFRELPWQKPPPLWMRKLGVDFLAKPGLEVFTESARLTQACLQQGLSMFEPVDASATWIEEAICQKKIGWIWLAPPCATFSALRNLDRGGPLRPRGNLLGNERNPDIALGNFLWRRALYLAELAYRHGVFFFLEHPRSSKAWQLKDTQQLVSLQGTSLHEFHWCMYEDCERANKPNKKPTKILSTGPWLKHIVRVCNGQHEHGTPLRGDRAKLGGAYPWGFCEQFANALLFWYGAPEECWLDQSLQAKSC